MAEITEESLISSTYWPTKGGRMTFIDWGRMTCRSCWYGVQARGGRRLSLAGRDRQDASGDDLADEAGGQVGQRDHGRREGLKLDAEFREKEKDDEDLDQKRGAADEIHPGADQGLDNRLRGPNDAQQMKPMTVPPARLRPETAMVIHSPLRKKGRLLISCSK